MQVPHAIKARIREATSRGGRQRKSKEKHKKYKEKVMFEKVGVTEKLTPMTGKQADDIGIEKMDQVSSWVMNSNSLT